MDSKRQGGESWQSDGGTVKVRSTNGRTGAGAQTDSLESIPPGRGTFLAAQNLNPQKARILLMLALAAKFDAMGIHELFRSR